ncbi:hypothetical protein D3C76_1061540 [compost metagenome]
MPKTRKPLLNSGTSLCCRYSSKPGARLTWWWPWPMQARAPACGWLNGCRKSTCCCAPVVRTCGPRRSRSPRPAVAAYRCCLPAAGAAVPSACAASVWPASGSSTGVFSRPLNSNWRLPRSCVSRNCRRNCTSNGPATRPGSTSRWPARPRPCGAAIPVAAAGTACCIKPWPTIAACPCCCRACVMTTRWQQGRPLPANT